MKNARTCRRKQRTAVTVLMYVRIRVTNANVITAALDQDQQPLQETAVLQALAAFSQSEARMSLTTSGFPQFVHTTRL